MNTQHSIKILESMMKWTAEMQPGRSIIETKWKPNELKSMGLQELKGKFHHTISVNGFDTRFQILPRKA